MSSYEVVLFLHVIALVAAFASSGILHLALFQMRASRSVADLRLWAGLEKRFATLMPVAALALFATGAYLVHDTWTWSVAWVETSIAVLVLISLLGGVSGKRTGPALGRAIGRAGDGSLTPELAGLVRKPEAWIVSHVLTMLSVAVIWIMVTKPEMGECVAALVCGIVVGAAAALPFCRPAQAAVSDRPAAT